MLAEHIPVQIPVPLIVHLWQIRGRLFEVGLQRCLVIRARHDASALRTSDAPAGILSGFALTYLSPEHGERIRRRGIPTTKNCQYSAVSMVFLAIADPALVRGAAR